ncbi:MAG: AraC family transcriptional regulator [Planctomycetota bacterium]|jgi:AraC-like DNA-binding protein
MSTRAPFIVYANHANFSGERTPVQPMVESRLCLWSRSGAGTVRVNGETLRLDPFDYLFLPWGPEMLYSADPRDPFHLSGIHLIPSYRFRGEDVFRVSHNIDSPLHRSSDRRDAPLEGLKGLVRYRVSTSSPLYLFSEYVVSTFQGRGPEREQVKRLALSLLDELRAARQGGDEELAELPASLREVLQSIDDNLHRGFSVEDVARALKRSTSQTRRLFARWLDCSPVEYINRRRVEQARRLLSTTRMPVARVAVSVGLDDPFYFSRLFKRHTGLSPLAYRKTGSLV